jgi:hypothetical protein
LLVEFGGGLVAAPTGGADGEFHPADFKDGFAQLVDLGV